MEEQMQLQNLVTKIRSELQQEMKANQVYKQSV